MGNNLVQLYFGWEAVGLCSYFLIGFWYEKNQQLMPVKRHLLLTG